MTYLDTSLDAIIIKAREQGYLTYDQVSEYLPDEDVNPEKLDNFALGVGRERHRVGRKVAQE